MKNPNPALALLLFTLVSILFASPILFYERSVTSQTRERKTNSNTETPSPAENATGASRQSPADIVKVDVDLVRVDALVLQKDTARIVGGLKKEDFLLVEDGAKQEITHFSQDSLPLSVILLIDRGGCLDPFATEVRRATREAIHRLKPTDEVAVMAYHDTTSLIQRFTRNGMLVEDALNRVPPHEEEAPHCLDTALADAADYMLSAGNPVGRRVVIVISGLKRAFDCPGEPSGKSAAQAIYESGSVVCGIIPKLPLQGLENGIMTMATRFGKLGGAPYTDLQTLANETGGEILSDKPEKLDATFQTLIDHLRSRYNLAFVSTNKKQDGTTRKLTLNVTPPDQPAKQKLVIKARRSYVAPRR